MNCNDNTNNANNNHENNNGLRPPDRRRGRRRDGRSRIIHIVSSFQTTLTPNPESFINTTR